jgi:hypothetical protein
MKIAVDIRPALRQGTGVGTFIENLVIALSKSQTDSHFYLFSSSLKDRLPDKPWRGLEKLQSCRCKNACSTDEHHVASMGLASRRLFYRQS